MATYVVGGIERVRYAPASLLGVVIAGDWKEIPNIAPGTVKFTDSIQQKTSIIPEEQDVAFVNFYTPGEGDTLTLGVLEQNPALLQALYNVDWAAATSTMDFKAKKKIANLAFEITTRPMKDGRKYIITIYNSEVQVSTDGNLTKDAVETKVLNAVLGTYRPAGKTEDYIYSKVLVNADGSPVNSTTV